MSIKIPMIGCLVALCLLLSGCISKDNATKELSATVDNSINLIQELKALESRLNYAAYLFYRENGYYPNSKNALDAFGGKNFQGNWTNGFEIQDVTTSAINDTSVKVALKLARGTGVFSVSFDYDKSIEYCYRLEANSMELNDEEIKEVLAGFFVNFDATNIASKYYICSSNFPASAANTTINLTQVEFVRTTKP
jgi:hypothetical protein